MRQPGRPLRVCFMIEQLMPAGTELWILRAMQQLDRRLVQPSLCLLDGTSEVSRSLEPTEAPVLSLGVTDLKHPRAWRQVLRLMAFLRRQRIDVLQVHHAAPTYMGVLAATLAGVPYIVQTKYSIGYWLSRRDLWLHRICNYFVDATIANCQACRVAAIQQERVVPDQIVVIENGIPLDRYPLRPRQRDGFRVALVANLREVKDPQSFVQAAHLVRERYSRSTFHVAGDGPLRESLVAQIGSMGLADCVFMHGSVTDVPAFLSESDVAVLCSRSEGLPHVLMEYMAAGLPIVATDVGGNGELISHGVSGLLVPPSDPPRLAEAIMQFFADRSLAARCAQAARIRVRQRYSVDAMIGRFEAFYEGLLEGSVRQAAANLQAMTSGTS